MKDKPIVKKYYTISEVAKMMHVEASTVRYWEDEFEWIKIERYKGDHRRYQLADIEPLMQINTLLHHVRMTVEGVKIAYEKKYIGALQNIFITSQRERGHFVWKEDIIGGSAIWLPDEKNGKFKMHMPLDYYIPDVPAESD